MIRLDHSELIFDSSFPLCFILFNSLMIILQQQDCAMQADWQFPQKKQYPLSITYNPNLTDNSEYFVNPFLGYPNCPIIGRYNRGQYKIGETLMHIEFKCKFNQDIGQYSCGQKALILPQFMLNNIRNIPEIIATNKPPNLKNVPQFLPEKYPVMNQLSVIWIVSFGQLGKDFLNYLNHMYILANTLFQQDKLPRLVHYLPIYAYLPVSSGLHHQEVEKGLNFHQYRAEYMSFHLNKGAPAFSPNNMRLCLLGGKIITSKQNKKEGKKVKQKYVEKQKKQQQQIDKKQQISKQQEQKDLIIDWDQIEKQEPQKLPKAQNKKIPQVHQKNQPHQGFVHFYTSVLLENDYRIYYHWHIEDQYKEDMIKQILRNAPSIEDFLQKYCNVLGKDVLYSEISNLLYQHHA